MSLGRYTGTTDSNVKQLYLDGKEFYNKPVLSRVKLLKENFSHFSYNSEYFRSDYLWFHQYNSINNSINSISSINVFSGYEITEIEILHYRFRLKTVVKEIIK